MLRMKLKAFLKYKGYRNQVLLKGFKDYGIKLIVFLTIAAGLFVNTKILAKDSQLKELGATGLNKISQYLNEKKQAHIQPAKPATNQDITVKRETAPEVSRNSLIQDKKEDASQVNERLKELERENQKLKDDNLNYQNWLKVTASRGTKPRNYIMPPQITSRSGILRGKYLGYFTVTAYSPTKEECGNDKGITSSGHPIVPGVTVAVDRKYWPVGTIFYIKGLGYVMAMDSGGAIKGSNRFDFAVLDTKFAKQIGRRKLEVYLIKMGNGKVGDIKFE